MKPEQVLQNLSELLSTDNIFMDILREMGWIIVMLLKDLLDVVDTAVDNTYKLVTFLNSAIVESNIKVLGPIVIAVLAIAIAILGYKVIFKRDNKANSFTGILLAITIMMALPIIFNQGIKLVNAMTQNGTLSTDKDKGSIADKIIKENVHDLMKYAEYDNFQLQGTVYNDIPFGMIRHLDMTEVLNNSDIPDKNKGIVNKQLDFNKDGKVIAKKFNETFITGRDGYYRYHINWFSMILSMVIVGVTLLLIGVKTVKIIFNLALDRIIGTILIFTDLEEGSRAKELLKHILSTFAVLMGTVLSINLYIEFVGWIQTVDLGKGFVAVISNIVILLGMSIALLEGPSIIQKLLGTKVDSGLSNSMIDMKRVGMAGKEAIKPIAKMAGHFAKDKNKNNNKNSGISKEMDKGSNSKSNKGNISNNMENKVNKSTRNESSKDNFTKGNTNHNVGEDREIDNNNNIMSGTYSDIESGMREAGFKVDEDNNKYSDSSDKNFEYSDMIDKDYKKNIPDNMDFDEGLRNHANKTSDKRMELNSTRRSKREEGLKTGNKYKINSKLDNQIPKNYTKGGSK